MKTKRAKAFASKWLDLSKFDVKRYDACSDLDIVGWSGSLYFRFVVRGVLLGPKNRASDLSDDQGIDLLLQMLAKPIPTTPQKPIWSPAKYRSVYDVSIYDMWTMREYISDWPDAISVCRRLDEQYEKGELTETEESNPGLKSFHSYLLEKKPSAFRSTEPMIHVDLGATDEQIKAQFAEWLNSKRDETRNLRSYIPAKFTQTHFRKWHSHRVLAFIDLTLLAYHLDLTLTDEMVANRLFPDESEVGVTERIRKTVRPLAERLMTPEMIDAMDKQAGFEWNSRKENLA
jgi:uncharacterized protein DUF6387